MYILSILIFCDDCTFSKSKVCFDLHNFDFDAADADAAEASRKGLKPPQSPAKSPAKGTVPSRIAMH